jgi:hypothetical protein
MGFLKKEPQDKPIGCFDFLIFLNSSGKYDSNGPHRRARLIVVETTKNL